MKTLCLVVPALVAMLAAGCTSSLKTSSVLSGTTAGWYSVAANQTPFYRYGPQQASGPDQQLPHDSIMKVIRPSFGYVKVQLQDGENGYVASEDIAPAGAALVAEKLAPAPVPVPVSEPSYAGQGEQFDLDSSDPRLVAPPEPLPLASPSPEFHY